MNSHPLSYSTVLKTSLEKQKSGSWPCSWPEQERPQPSETAVQQLAVRSALPRNPQPSVASSTKFRRPGSPRVNAIRSQDPQQPRSSPFQRVKTPSRLSRTPRTFISTPAEPNFYTPLSTPSKNFVNPPSATSVYSTPINRDSSARSCITSPTPLPLSRKIEEKIIADLEENIRTIEQKYRQKWDECEMYKSRLASMELQFNRPNQASIGVQCEATQELSPVRPPPVCIPPPPPPPPPPVMQFPAAVRKVTAYRASKSHPQPQKNGMADVIKHIGQVNLRKIDVRRSPGGTILRNESAPADYRSRNEKEPVRSLDFEAELAAKLKAKFRNARPTPETPERPRIKKIKECAMVSIPPPRSITSPLEINSNSTTSAAEAILRSIREVDNGEGTSRVAEGLPFRSKLITMEFLSQCEDGDRTEATSPPSLPSSFVQHPADDATTAGPSSYPLQNSNAGRWWPISAPISAITRLTSALAEYILPPSRKRTYEEMDFVGSLPPESPDVVASPRPEKRHRTESTFAVTAPSTPRSRQRLRNSRRGRGRGGL